MENKLRIEPADQRLQYSGRIQWTKSKEPVFVYACTSLSIQFVGCECSIQLTNIHQFWNNYLGVLVDGRMYSIQLKDGEQTVCIAEGLDYKEHSILIYKRMDACHYIRIHSLLFDEKSILQQAAALPKRRIEVYGDSVSCGEVSEAVAYVGKQDPIHNGEYSNSYYSYSWITARKLNAELHNISQGGIALLDHTGFFNQPDYLGMEWMYDKVCYNPALGETTTWDFRDYTPHVVIIAIGQNDSYPNDYMKASYTGGLAIKWRIHYKAFVTRLRELYPNALILLTTTILEHDKKWDQAIDEVCNQIGDSRIKHFLYSKNGCGTPGHIRIPEANRMADELVEYIQSFGDEIWK